MASQEAASDLFAQLDYPEVREHYEHRVRIHKTLIRLHQNADLKHSLTFRLEFQMMPEITVRPSIRWSADTR